MASRRSDRFSARDALWLLVVTIIALALRLDHLYASNFVIDGDEAIVGLMAQHILNGQSWPTFYYGQHYMGSLEALLVALVGLFVGLSNFALKFVPLVCGVLLVPLVFFLARRVGGRVAAWSTALLIAIPPTALVVWSTKARGGFIEILVLGTIALLFAIRFSERGRVRNLFWAGVVLGLGWWINQQIVYFILPIAVWCCALLRVYELRDGRLYLDAFLRCIANGGAGFVIGSLPFWIYNFKHNFISFEILNAAKGGDVTAHLVGFVSQALPILVGAKEFWSAQEIFPSAWIIVAVVYGVVLIVGVFGSAILRPVDLARREALTSPVALLVMTILSCGVVFSTSSFGWLSQAPRYLLPAYVPLFALFGVGIAAIWHNNRGIALVLLSVTTLFNLYTSFPDLQRAIPGEPFVSGTERVAKDHTELIDWLTFRKIDWIRTNYWIGYRLAFETKEAVRFRVFQEPKQERIDSYIDATKDQDLERLPLVLAPSQAKLVEQALHAIRTRYKRAHVGEYVVIYDLIPEPRSASTLSPNEFTVHASDSVSSAPLAVDDDLQTRWGSARPQSPDMYFVVNFLLHQRLDSLRYSMLKFESDYPRELEILGRTPDGAEIPIIDRAQYRALRYYLDGRLDLQLPLPDTELSQIELRQVGSDAVFDWSIVELQFFNAQSPLGATQ